MSVKKLSELTNIEAHTTNHDIGILNDEDLFEVSLNDEPSTGDKVSSNVTFLQLKNSFTGGLVDNDLLDGFHPNEESPLSSHSPTQKNVKTYVDNVKFGDLADCDPLTPVINDLVIWDGTKFTYSAPSENIHTLCGPKHNDVEDTTPSNGDILVYNSSTAKWEPAAHIEPPDYTEYMIHYCNETVWSTYSPNNYYANIPLAWKIDVTGRCFVHLSVEPTHDDVFYFKPNGESKNVSHDDSGGMAAGTSGVYVDDGNIGYVSLITSPSQRIEFFATHSNWCTIKLLTYQKLLTD